MTIDEGVAALAELIHDWAQDEISVASGELLDGTLAGELLVDSKSGELLSDPKSGGLSSDDGIDAGAETSQLLCDPLKASIPDKKRNELEQYLVPKKCPLGEGPCDTMKMASDSNEVCNVAVGSHKMGAEEMSISFVADEVDDESVDGSDGDVSRKLIALADDKSESSFEWIPKCARDSTDDRDYGDEDTEDLRARAVMWAAVIRGDKTSLNTTFMSWEYEYHDDDDSDSASVVSNDNTLVSVVSGSQASGSSHVSFEDDDVNTLMETT
jgi:hypothetical protein